MSIEANCDACDHPASWHRVPVEDCENWICECIRPKEKE